MGIVFMFFLVPAFTLLLANLFFFFSNFSKTSIKDFKKASLTGVFIALIGLTGIFLKGDLYIFSFFIHILIIFIIPLLISLLFYLKRDDLSINKGFLINTTVFTSSLIFILGLYFTRNLDWYHY